VCAAPFQNHVMNYTPTKMTIGSNDHPLELKIIQANDCQEILVSLFDEYFW
jgi:hypothetical protein